MASTPNLDHPGLAALAERQSRVVLVSQLGELGITRAQRRAHIDAGRWRRLGRSAVVVDLGPLVGETAWWAALAQTARGARLGGVTALQVAGLRGYTEPCLHVWVERPVHHGRPPGVCLHVTRRWSAEDLAHPGIPRSRPDVAAVQAALWARSGKQASLCLVMTVQQRLATATAVTEQLDRVRSHPYRGLLRAVMRDIAGGAQSLGELDFASRCRQAGLPEPTRQFVVETEEGRRYLDVRWVAYRVRLEVDGAHHLLATNRLEDELRDVDGNLEGDRVLRLSALNLRANPGRCMERVARSLRQGGWQG